MRGVLKWLSIAVVIATVTAAFAYAVMAISGAGVTVACGGSADAWQRCDGDRTYVIARGAYFSSLVAIVLSFLGTLALVATIYLSAKATKAALRATDLAASAVEHARRTAAAELRPYISAVDHSRHYVSKPDGSIDYWFVRIHWKNTGRTPARNVRAKTNHVISATPLPEAFDFPDREMDDSVGTIGIDAAIQSPTGNITIADIQTVVARQAKLYIWSWIEYEGDDPSLRFRSEYHVYLDLWDGDGTTSALSGAPMLISRFNGIDAGCTRLPTTPTAPRLADRTA